MVYAMDLICDNLAPLIKLIKHGIIPIIQIGIPIILIVLGMLDFTKAVAVSEDGATKKAGIKFLKRLIAVVIIFLLPTLINFILSTFNLKEPLGIDDKCIEMSD